MSEHGRGGRLANFSAVLSLAKCVRDLQMSVLYLLQHLNDVAH